MNTLKSLFKVSKLAFFALFAVLLSCGDEPFDEILTVPNIRIVQVDADTDVVIIANFGGASEDISDYQLGVRNSFQSIRSLAPSAILELANRAFVTIEIPLNDISSDVSLFSSTNFTSTEDMVDFMQYGADVGSDGSVDLAIEKGIWEQGTFVANASPYTYLGDGTQLNVSAWRGTISQAGEASNIRLIQVDPTQGTVTLKNFGDAEQNVSNFLICTLRACGAVAGLTDQQDLTLDPDEELLLEVRLPVDASDVALYSNDAFSSPSAMLDFMQYGADVTTEGYATVAVAKGIWSAGTFVSGTGPYDYTGNGTDLGAANWMGN